MAEEIDPMAKAFLDHQEMEETRAYLERGREFDGAPVEGISEAWALAFKLVYEYGEISHRHQLDVSSAPKGVDGTDVDQRNADRIEPLGQRTSLCFRAVAGQDIGLARRPAEPKRGLLSLRNSSLRQ